MLGRIFLPLLNGEASTDIYIYIRERLIFRVDTNNQIDEFLAQMRATAQKDVRTNKPL
jgi:hypothetical protein